MPQAFTQQQRNWIAGRLLEEGDRQFSAFGLKKTRVEELAAACGISKAAFYLFYPSKEAPFMDVVERAEERMRREVLAAVDLPGTAPRARLALVFKKAFSLWKATPLLQFFTRSDYELLAQKMPADKIQEHMGSDRQFMEDLFARCRSAGIPVCVQAQQVGGLMYALFFAALHENDFGPGGLGDALDVLFDLTAAYCLGEIQAAHQGETQ